MSRRIRISAIALLAGLLLVQVAGPAWADDCCVYEHAACSTNCLAAPTLPSAGFIAPPILEVEPRAPQEVPLPTPGTTMIWRPPIAVVLDA